MPPVFPDDTEGVWGALVCESFSSFTVRSRDRPPLAKVFDRSRWLASNEVSCKICGIVIGVVAVSVLERGSADWEDRSSALAISAGSDRLVGVVELSLLCPKDSLRGIIDIWVAEDSLVLFQVRLGWEDSLDWGGFWPLPRCSFWTVWEEGIPRAEARACVSNEAPLDLWLTRGGRFFLLPGSTWSRSWWWSSLAPVAAASETEGREVWEDGEAWEAWEAWEGTWASDGVVLVHVPDGAPEDDERGAWVGSGRAKDEIGDGDVVGEVKEGGEAV